MIVGSHIVLYSRDAEADRAFLRDVLKLSHVDVGGGWLIFGLPPSEVAFHPTDGAQSHEFYLMCEDVGAFIQAMKTRALTCTPVRGERWGLLTQLTLPGGGKLGVYQPRHARPKPTAAALIRRRGQKEPSRKLGKPARPSTRLKRAKR